MIRVNGHITLSCTLKSTLNERKSKQNTHLKQDLCSGFSRLCPLLEFFSCVLLRPTNRSVATCEEFVAPISSATARLVALKCKEHSELS